MSKVIPVYVKNVASDLTTVDDEDFDRFRLWRWTLLITPSGKRYAKRTTRDAGKTVHIFLHKEILQLACGGTLKFPQDQVDHRDQDGLNNRRLNLRVASAYQNAANVGLRKGCQVPYKGVALFKGRYRARITAQGVVAHLGVHDSPIGAARAYDAAALRLHGEFAVLNFPEEWFPGRYGHLAPRSFHGVFRTVNVLPPPPPRLEL